MHIVTVGLGVNFAHFKNVNIVIKDIYVSPFMQVGVDFLLKACRQPVQQEPCSIPSLSFEQTTVSTVVGSPGVTAARADSVLHKTF